MAQGPESRFRDILLVSRPSLGHPWQGCERVKRHLLNIEQYHSRPLLLGIPSMGMVRASSPAKMLSHVSTPSPPSNHLFVAVWGSR